MSRSIKKPWIKDPSNSWMKRIHSRRMRRISNSILSKFAQEWDKNCWHSGEGNEWRIYTPIEPVFPIKHQVTNQYNICDYIMYCKDDVKYTRK